MAYRGHGTDTMVETGLYVQRTLAEVHMPIVLTGAMTPLGFEGSDGLQNLTESLLAVQLIRPGVYVVMHNRYVAAQKMLSDTEKLREGKAFPVFHNT
jgi:L-asparaginase